MLNEKFATSKQVAEFIDAQYSACGYDIMAANVEVNEYGEPTEFFELSAIEVVEQLSHTLPVEIWGKFDAATVAKHMPSAWYGY